MKGKYVKTRNYNLIDWWSIFMEDSTSPTGLIWKISIGSGMYKKVFKAKAGEPAGFIDGDYAKVRYNRCDWFVHRILWVMRNREIEEGFIIDHIDGNTLNNSPSNLRKTKQAINSRNRKLSVNNTSGKTGVSFTVSHGYTYALSSWNIKTNKLKQKWFSCNTLGLMPAYAAACLHRDTVLKELNDEGFGYTERHGT